MICLPMQGTGVPSLVWEDPTCPGATKLQLPNRALQQLNPLKRSPSNATREQTLLTAAGESPRAAKTQGSQNKERNITQKSMQVKTCILPRVKQITSPGGMPETSAPAWCTGKTQRDRVEREVGGGIGMGNTCKSMADSCQCMTKPTTIL